MEAPKYSRKAFDKTEEQLKAMRESIRGDMSTAELLSAVQQKERLENQKDTLYDQAFAMATEEDTERSYADGVKTKKRQEISPDKVADNEQADVVLEQIRSMPEAVPAMPENVGVADKLGIQERVTVSTEGISGEQVNPQENEFALGTKTNIERGYQLLKEITKEWVLGEEDLGSRRGNDPEAVQRNLKLLGGGKDKLGTLLDFNEIATSKRLYSLGSRVREGVLYAASTSAAGGFAGAGLFATELVSGVAVPAALGSPAAAALAAGLAGIPVVAAVGLAYYLYKKWQTKQSSSRRIQEIRELYA